MERERWGIAEINSYGKPFIDSLPKGMKAESERIQIEVKGGRGRNKSMRGHTHPPKPPLPLLLHTNTLSSVKGKGLIK